MSDATSILIRITNIWLYVVGELPDDLRKEIQTKLSYIEPGFKFMPGYKAMVLKAEAKSKDLGIEVKPEWDGTKTVARFLSGNLQCPTGLLSYIREILDARKIPYTIQECRLPAVKSSGWVTADLTLREYQDQISTKVADKQRGVMKMSTGSGKTETIIAAIIKASVFPVVYYVPSCDLLEQTYNRMMMYLRFNGLAAEIGRVGNGHCDIHPVTIATVQSCERALTGKFTKYAFDDVDEDDETAFTIQQKDQIKLLVQEAQFVYVDECQHTSAKTIQTVLNNSYKARYRIGGSASPWRDDGLDILIEACFGRKICDIDASYLIEHPEHYLVRPQIVFHHFRQYLGSTSNFNEHYKKFVVENSVRNQWIANRALFHVERDRPTFIIVKWSRHAEILKEFIDQLFKGCEVLTSSGKHKLSPTKRKGILDKMKNREILCCIGTSLLDEGIDVPVATAGIMAGGGKSSTRALQRIGRLIRRDPNDASKDVAYIDEIYDHCKFLDHHAARRRAIYETERSFNISDDRETIKL